MSPLGRRSEGPIHPSAWKVNSPKFAQAGFCELRLYAVLLSTAQPRPNTYRRPAIGPGQCSYSAKVVNFAYVAFGSVGAEGGARFSPVRVYGSMTD